MRPAPWRSAPWGRESAGKEGAQGWPRKVFASQGAKNRQGLRLFLRRKTRRAAFQAEFQGALAWTTAGATLFPRRALGRFAYPRGTQNRKEQRYGSRAASMWRRASAGRFYSVRSIFRLRVGPRSAPLERYATRTRATLWGARKPARQGLAPRGYSGGLVQGGSGWHWDSGGRVGEGGLEPERKASLVISKPPSRTSCRPLGWVQAHFRAKDRYTASSGLLTLGWKLVILATPFGRRVWLDGSGTT